METQTNGAAAQNKKGGGKKAVLIILVLAIIAVLIGVIIYLLMHRDAPADEQEDQSLRNVVITQDNLEETIAQMGEQEFTETGYYTVTMNNEWHFPTGSDVSTDAYVENAVENISDVYFDLFLENDEENPIYQSPVIPIGSSLTQIALDKDLDPGTYDCIMVYHLVDENQNTTSTLKVAVTVTIEG